MHPCLNVVQIAINKGFRDLEYYEITTLLALPLCF